MLRAAARSHSIMPLPVGVHVGECKKHKIAVQMGGRNPVEVGMSFLAGCWNKERWLLLNGF